MKLSTNKKKIIVLTSMVLLLVVAGTLNFVLNTTLKKNDPSGGTITTTFFSQQRTMRETSRTEQMTWLDSIIKSDKSTKEAIAAAENEKLTLSKMIEKERVLETLVKSKGFEEAVVTLTADKISVIVQKPGMTEADAATILDVILEQTTYVATQIAVIPYQAS